MRRLLPSEEWHRLREPIKQLFGEDKEPPDPGVAPLCAVEENDEGDIIGFLFFQLAAHLEPYGSMGGASFSGLREVIDNALTNMPGIVYYLHTDSPLSQAVYESKGFKKIGVLLAGEPNRVD
jgi:hypothetical protein